MVDSPPDIPALSAPAPKPPKPRRPPWGRRRFLLVWWAGQALLGYFGWPLLTSNSLGDLRQIPEVLTSADYMSVMLPFLALIMAAQAVMVFPVPRPREKRTPGAGFAHFIGAGLVVAAALVTAFELALLGATVYFPGPWCAEPVSNGWPLLLATTGAEWPLCALWLWSRYRRGVPAAVSALIAGTAAALMIGTVLTLAVTLWDEWFTVTGAAGAYAAHGIVWTIVVSWAVATLLVRRFLKRADREIATARIASRLFLGTVIEAGAIIPFDLMLRRKHDCYCLSPTLWGLTVCLAVGSLALGPVVWFIPMGRRRRRGLGGCCEVCGYDMTGLKLADRCPECGAGWRESPPPTPANPAS